MIYIFKVFHYCLSILTKGGNSIKNSTCKREKTHQIQSKISTLDFVSDSLAHFQTFVYPKSIHIPKYTYDFPFTASKVDV